MLPEQQQRILGYFIEEARDHLNTIEQGLLNLQGTLDDSEMINEVFRAAHSVKGGAAMLGLSSIQKVSHRLEDCFKLLKENSDVGIDQKLESLFLSASDTLKALLEHLQGPFGLSEEKAAELISDSEPTFKSLQEHLDSLIAKGKGNTSSAGVETQGVDKQNNSVITNAENTSPGSNLKHIQNQVLQTLREMLQLFKQQTTPENREQLEKCTQGLVEIGEAENLTNWSSLCRAAKSAIANPDNTYLVLAKVVITEIKGGLELVLANRDEEITISQHLNALIPEIELLDISSPIDIVDTLDSSNENNQSSQTSDGAVESVEELIFSEEDEDDRVSQPTASENINSLLDLDIFGQFDADQFYDDEDDLDLTDIDTGGPEVGIFELNTLADLFDGETPDLDRSWKEEKVSQNSIPDEQQVQSVENIDDDNDNEFIKDFLCVEDNKHKQEEGSEAAKDELTLVQLFGNFLDEEDFASDTPVDAEPNSKDDSDTDLFTDSRVPEKGELELDIDSFLSEGLDDDNELDTNSTINLTTNPDSLANQDSLELDNELPWSEIDDIEELQPVNIGEIPLDKFIGGNETNSLNNFQPDLLEDPSSFDGLLSSTELTNEDSNNILDFTEENQDIFNERSPSILDSEILDSEIQKNKVPKAVEEDVAKELEASLSNSDNNIFIDISDDGVNNGDGDFDLADIDFDIDFDSEGQVDLDLGFSQDNTDDLFGVLPSIPSENLSSNQNKDKVSPQEMRGLSGSPEALESVPEFTNLSPEKPTKESLILPEKDIEKISSDSNINNYNQLDKDENLQDLFADLPTVASNRNNNDTDSDLIEVSTNIEEASVPGEVSNNIDDLFAVENMTDNQVDNNIPEISTQANSLDAINSDVEEVSVPGEVSNNIDDLFAVENLTDNQVNNNIPEISTQADSLDAINSDIEEVSVPGEASNNIDDLFAVENLPDNQVDNNISEISTQINSLDAINSDIEEVSVPREASNNIDDLFAVENLPDNQVDTADLFDRVENILDTNLEEIELPSSKEDDIFQDLEASIDISELQIDTPNQRKILEEKTVFQELEADISLPNLEIDEDCSTDFLDNLEGYNENIQIPVDTSKENTDNSNNLEELFSDDSNNSIEDVFSSNTFQEDENTSTKSISENKVTSDNNVVSDEEFDRLEFLLNEEPVQAAELETPENQDQDFAALEALLDEDSSFPQPLVESAEANSQEELSVTNIEDEFSDLQKLLDEVDNTLPTSPAAQTNRRPSVRRAAREKTMKVPVKHLDDMSNLVGELVVNRNTLEQDQERLRQFLDNLLHQIQQLSDVGSRMQELYERSLLEASLLASNKKSNNDRGRKDIDRGFNELEMDMFTPFHTLSQEMIELIVRVRESSSDIEFVTEETERVARQFRQVTTQLQEGLTRSRMVPFAEATDRLKRGVRDNAIKCGKQVELVIEGQDTLIDKMILEHLTNPLTHMLNNAIAHGIETPEKRTAKGKSPGGAIHVCALYQGNQTVISVKDDGAGIDPKKVKEKAINKGLLSKSEAKNMSDIDIYELLFEPGFSTKDQADDLAGRGVGMDVVRTEISEIRGTVSIDSTIDKGTDFTIRLPVTLSICKALSCVSERSKIAFPMDGVEDTLDVPVKNIITDQDGKKFISWRDTKLPFKPLKDLLTFNRLLSRGSVYGGTRDDDMVSVIVVRSANKMIALQVDQVLSEQEIVIKQFEAPAPKPFGVAGATVLGDGRIMAIADVLEILDIFEGRTTKQNSVGLWEQNNNNINQEIIEAKVDPTVLIVDDSITVRELLSLTFSKAGYRVEQARDGQEAWDKLRSGLPCDIIFCDIEMPRCDGLELLSRIQDDENLDEIPIAMLTSRGADKHRQMAVELGASGYFTKPYLEEALLEAASRMLKGEKLVG
ncbi:MAG: response regulator [Cyanobacteria bacterium P01_A01_bin.84]